jgi:hypothetical protein
MRKRVGLGYIQGKEPLNQSLTFDTAVRTHYYVICLMKSRDILEFLDIGRSNIFFFPV